MAAIPTLVPFGQTAQRLEWHFLPPHIRGEIEARCGSPVIAADSRRGGYTPGFASVLTCADGSRHFVKAASVPAQRAVAEAYREEARRLRHLPAAVPAPRLLWCVEEDWVVLGIDHVEGHRPRRPWQIADLEAALDAVEASARALTPAPSIPKVATFAEDFAAYAGAWDRIRALEPHLARIDEAETLARRVAEVTAGETLVHTDLRDDKILLDPAGRVRLCDWSLSAVGAAWLDPLILLIGPRGDGVDVEAVLAAHPSTTDVPAEHIDAVLALLAGFFLLQCHQPVPPTSPHLRDFQSWQASVVWDWLAERRGWDR